MHALLNVLVRIKRFRHSSIWCTRFINLKVSESFGNKIYKMTWSWLMFLLHMKIMNWQSKLWSTIFSTEKYTSLQELWDPVRVYFAFKVYKYKCNTSSEKLKNELCSVRSSVDLSVRTYKILSWYLKY